MILISMINMIISHIFSLWYLYAAAFFTRIINKKEHIIKCNLDSLLLDTSCADIKAEMFVSIDQ